MVTRSMSRAMGDVVEYQLTMVTTRMPKRKRDVPAAAAPYTGCPCKAHGPWPHRDRMRSLTALIGRGYHPSQSPTVGIVYLRLPWCCSVPDGDYETDAAEEKFIIYFPDTEQWCSAPALKEFPGPCIQLGVDGVVPLKHDKVIPGHRLVCRFCYVTDEWIIEVREQKLPVARDQPQQTTLTGMCEGRLTFEKLHSLPANAADQELYITVPEYTRKVGEKHKRSVDA